MSEEQQKQKEENARMYNEMHKNIKLIVEILGIDNDYQNEQITTPAEILHEMYTNITLIVNKLKLNDQEYGPIDGNAVINNILDSREYNNMVGPFFEKQATKEFLRKNLFDQRSYIKIKLVNSNGKFLKHDGISDIYDIQNSDPEYYTNDELRKIFIWLAEKYQPFRTLLKEIETMAKQKEQTNVAVSSGGTLEKYKSTGEKVSVIINKKTIIRTVYNDSKKKRFIRINGEYKLLKKFKISK